MPDFDRLADRLRADLNQAHWPDATRIRAAGEHSRRTRFAAVAAAATAIAVIVLAAVLVPGAFLRGGPTTAASPPPTPGTPTRSAPATTSPSPSSPTTRRPSPGTLSPSVLLPASDFAPFNRRVGQPSPTRKPVESFMACTGGATHYQYPADAMPVAGLQRSFSDGMQNTETAGVELVQRFRPGGAHAALTDIDRLIADCGGQYAVIARDLGGKESLLIRADEKAIGGEYSHGHVMYNAIARDGDYLIWIQIVQNQQRAGHGYTQAQLVQWVRSAARHADQKACTATAC